MRVPRGLCDARGLAATLAASLVGCCGAAFGQNDESVGTRGAQRELNSRILVPRTTPPAAPARDSAPTRRVALVVGNGGYRSLNPLRNATNDAVDMCDALRRLAFDASCHLNVATRAEFRRLLRSFASQIGPDTVALFYYAGHGVQLEGRNYLLPTTIAPNSSTELADEGLPLEEVFGTLKDSRSALSVIVLDACRDDPFARGRAIRVSRGLAREDPPTGSVLVYSTAPGGVAADGSGRNGLFTSQLLAQIEKPGPQIGEMFHNVARLVEAQARNDYNIEQVPYRSFSYTGVFCFANCDDNRLAQDVELLKQQRALAVQRIQELEARNKSLSSESGQASAAAAELRALRAELAELAAKSAQLEAFRQRIAVLEGENREKERQIVEAAKKEAGRKSSPAVVPTF
jgi:uncharacterized caspase-like protein